MLVTFNGFMTLLQGAGVTLLVSVTGIVLGVPLGLALALIRWGRVPILRQVVTAHPGLNGVRTEEAGPHWVVSWQQKCINFIRALP